MTDEWTPEAARERLEVVCAQLGDDGIAIEMDCLEQQLELCADLTHALDALAAEAGRADRLDVHLRRVVGMIGTLSLAPTPTEVGNLWIAAQAALQSGHTATSARLAQYEAALRFYADPDNYVLAGEPAATGELHAWAPPVLGDDGERARAALKGKSV